MQISSNSVRFYQLVLLGSFCIACTDSAGGAISNQEEENGDATFTHTGTSDADTDTDVDGDTDTDTDTDTDLDTDTDSEIDVDTKTDVDTVPSDNDTNDNQKDSDTTIRPDSDTNEHTDTHIDDIGTDTVTDGDTDTVADTYTNPADGGEPDASDDVCASIEITVEAKPVKMMIVQDLSVSMAENNKWNQARSALNAMLTAYQKDIAFGFDTFPNKASCGVSDPLHADCALNNAEAIIDLFPVLRLVQGTPLYRAMDNFTDPAYAPIFSMNDLDRYLLIVSDGGDTCYDTEIMGNGATPEQMSELTEELLTVHGIKTVVIGFGLGTDVNEDGESLNAIAKSGGVNDAFIEVQSETELLSAFTEISESLVSCSYEIAEQDEKEVDLDLVNIYFNGMPIPRDDGCTAQTGWSWGNEERTMVEFCNSSCERLQEKGTVDISIEIMCSKKQVIVI